MVAGRASAFSLTPLIPPSFIFYTYRHLAKTLFDLATNYFDLLGAKQSYFIDLSALKKKYLDLQRQVHPDNFASGSDKVRREAMQRVSYLNQAYETLKSPLQRAVYLLQISGNDFDPDTQVHSDPAFLMQQMELREALSEVSDADDPLAALDELRDNAEQNYQEYQNQFAEFCDQSKWQDASLVVNKMMFVNKLLREIAEKEEVLFD